ncbi:NUDIX domain-containing protein [Terrilactibacillus sp. BCM23-1]|uniref:NUDIX domain-containing protein n=1 Tax=Terrilactibacillus tamarindi TaxID=2599694 RepID=A0A6N8CL17_9BACI|nr:8-oxo-dGTP diphosphatase [Terrilactibacillus tamarindi]MTT30522.1 NUDIX domain-containing protein [Terrilactibacillus tamarindi]
MYQYTLAFLTYDHRIFMLNRQKSPWQGCWNGVGGKLEEGETPIQSVKREIKEETGIDSVKPIFKGTVSWTVNGKDHGGMYLFLVNLKEEQVITTPLKTREGILDFKSPEWLLNDENLGVVPTIRLFLSHILNENDLLNYHCYFNDDELKDYVCTALTESEISSLLSTKLKVNAQSKVNSLK